MYQGREEQRRVEKPSQIGGDQGDTTECNESWHGAWILRRSLVGKIRVSTCAD